MGREAGGRPGTGWDQAGQQRHSGSAAQPQPWCGAPTGCRLQEPCQAHRCTLFTSAVKGWGMHRSWET